MGHPASSRSKPLPGPRSKGWSGRRESTKSRRFYTAKVDRTEDRLDKLVGSQVTKILLNQELAYHEDHKEHNDYNSKKLELRGPSEYDPKNLKVLAEQLKKPFDAKDRMLNIANRAAN